MITISTDSWFVTGKSHAVCQDYARHGFAESTDKSLTKTPFIVLSDGCSSSPDTDIGARALCLGLATSKNLVSADSAEYLHSDVMQFARSMCSGLHPNCLDATLLYAYWKDNRLFYNMIGDGAVKVTTTWQEDGKEVTQTAVSITQYGMNAPPYLNYWMTRRWMDYSNEFGEDFALFTRTTSDDPGALYIPQEPILPYAMERYTKMIEPIIPTSGKWSVQITMISDGFDSFSPLKGTVYPTADANRASSGMAVIDELTRFANRTGEFVKRRGNRAMSDWAKLGIVNQDDLSVISMYIESDGN
jgi:hypothetical protein